VQLPSFSLTSQFFINLGENYQLDHQGETPDTYGYAVFGKVVEGMKVVEWIARIPTTSKDGFDDVPVHPIKIHHIKRIK